MGIEAEYIEENDKNKYRMGLTILILEDMRSLMAIIPSFQKRHTHFTGWHVTKRKITDSTQAHETGTMR